MTTYIKKSVEKAGTAAGTQQGASFPTVKIPARQRRNKDMLRTIGTTSILGLGLILSVFNGYLFFKELLVATAITGMAMLLKAAQHPAITISREDGDRAHLN